METSTESSCNFWACQRNPMGLWCYHSNQTSLAVLPHGTVCFVCSSKLWACGWNPIWCNLLNETSLAVLLHGTIWFVRQVVLSCEPVDEILFGCGVGSKLLAFGWNPIVWPFKWNLSQQYFHMVLFSSKCGSNFWICGWNPIVSLF